MSEYPDVDVRDMLCAQALAVVAQALDRLPAGANLNIRYNAGDVRQDLLAWAQALGHDMSEPEPQRLQVRKRTR